MWIFEPEKLHIKKYVESTWIFRPEKLYYKWTWKESRFFDHGNYIEKSMWKRHGFFDQWNYAEKSTWRWREFFDPRNYIEKVEMTYKFVQVWSSMYWGDIDVESMWIALGVPVKFTHPLSFILPLFSQNASQLFLPKGLWRFASTISRGSH